MKGAGAATAATRPQSHKTQGTGGNPERQTTRSSTNLPEDANTWAKCLENLRQHRHRKEFVVIDTSPLPLAEFVKMDPEGFSDGWEKYTKGIQKLHKDQRHNRDRLGHPHTNLPGTSKSHELQMKKLEKSKLPSRTDSTRLKRGRTSNENETKDKDGESSGSKKRINRKGSNKGKLEVDKSVTDGSSHKWSSTRSRSSAQFDDSSDAIEFTADVCSLPPALPGKTLKTSRLKRGSTSNENETKAKVRDSSGSKKRVHREGFKKGKSGVDRSVEERSSHKWSSTRKRSSARFDGSSDAIEVTADVCSLPPTLPGIKSKTSIRLKRGSTSNENETKAKVRDSSGSKKRVHGKGFKKEKLDVDKSVEERPSHKWSSTRKRSSARFDGSSDAIEVTADVCSLPPTLPGIKSKTSIRLKRGSTSNENETKDKDGERGGSRKRIHGKGFKKEKLDVDKSVEERPSHKWSSTRKRSSARFDGSSDAIEVTADVCSLPPTLPGIKSKTSIRLKRGSTSNENETKDKDGERGGSRKRIHGKGSKKEKLDVDKSVEERSTHKWSSKGSRSSARFDGSSNAIELAADVCSLPLLLPGKTPEASRLKRGSISNKNKTKDNDGKSSESKKRIHRKGFKKEKSEVDNPVKERSSHKWSSKWSRSSARFDGSSDAVEVAADVCSLPSPLPKIFASENTPETIGTPEILDLPIENSSEEAVGEFETVMLPETSDLSEQLLSKDDSTSTYYPMFVSNETEPYPRNASSIVCSKPDEDSQIDFHLNCKDSLEVADENVPEKQNQVEPASPIKSKWDVDTPKGEENVIEMVETDKHAESYFEDMKYAEGNPPSTLKPLESTVSDNNEMKNIFGTGLALFSPMEQLPHSPSKTFSPDGIRFIEELFGSSSECLPTSSSKTPKSVSPPNVTDFKFSSYPPDEVWDFGTLTEADDSFESLAKNSRLPPQNLPTLE